MATLRELQTVYSFQDALYLSEVLDLEEERQFLSQQKGTNGRHNN